MKKAKSKRKNLWVYLFLSLPLFALTGCSGEHVKTDLSEFDKCKIGTLNPTYKNLVNSSEKIKEINWVDFSNYDALHQAIVNKEIDAYVGEFPTLQYEVNNYQKLYTVPKNILENDFEYSFIFKNNTETKSFQNEFNEFLLEQKNTGNLSELIDKWTAYQNFNNPIEIEGDDSQTEVTFYYYESEHPFSFHHNSSDGEEKLWGLDFELVVNFCKEKEYYLNLQKVQNLDEVISNVKANDSDSNFAIGGGKIIASEVENKEGIVTSNSFYENGNLYLNAHAHSLQITSIEELNDPNNIKTVSVLKGAIFDKIVEQQIPNAKRTYYDSYPDCQQAILTGKSNAYATDEPRAIYAAAKNPNLKVLSEKLMDDKYAYIFPKNNEGLTLRDEFNKFFQKITKEGKLSRIKDKWYGTGKDTLSIPTIEDINKKNKGRTLKYATASEGGEPFDFYDQNTKDYTGYEIDIFKLFCQESEKYRIQILDGKGMGPITDVTEGRADLSGDGISITPERAEKVYFSDPTYIGGGALVIRDFAHYDSRGFFEKIGDAFYSILIQDKRYETFLLGILNTFLITVASILIGGVLGFGLFLLLKISNNNKVYDKILKAASWIIGVLPVVVILMIFYYVIFGSSNLSSLAISIIVYSLLFMCSTLNLLRLGTNAVDKGQEEAAKSLGYSKMSTFFKIILPQALKHIFPPLKGEISSLIKATSIVGYVAVLDLTKAADLIRSQTFEAFLPLLVVAIVYILFAVLFSFIINKINIRIDPKHRKKDKILKGIKTND